MRTIFLLIVGFGLGFFVRGYAPDVSLFPGKVSDVLVPAKASNGQPEQFITHVVYENGKFSQKSVTINKGNYLAITNNSDNLMWLDCTDKMFTTPRGYARSEQLRVKPMELGTYKIRNKLNVDAEFSVTVVE